MLRIASFSLALLLGGPYAQAQFRLEPPVVSLTFSTFDEEKVFATFAIVGVSSSTDVTLQVRYPSGGVEGWLEAERSGDTITVAADPTAGLKEGSYLAYVVANARGVAQRVSVRLTVTPSDNQFRFYRAEDFISDNTLNMTSTSPSAKLNVDFIGPGGIRANTGFEIRAQSADPGTNWLTVSRESPTTLSELSITARPELLTPRQEPYLGSILVYASSNPNNQSVLYVELIVSESGGDPTRLESDVPVRFAISGAGLANGPRGYWIDVPEGSISFEVAVNASSRVRIHARRNTDVRLSGQNVIADSTTIASLRPFLELTSSSRPPLQSGRYYVAISLGFSGLTTGEIVARVTNAQGIGPSLGENSVIAAGAFGGTAIAAPASFIEIYGTNLAGTIRGWTGTDFTDGRAPTSLDSVTVTVGGRAAYVNYVSPGQVNVQVPGDASAGDAVPVVVTYNGRSSPARNITLRPVSGALFAPPSFRVNGRQYAAALHLDGSLVSNGQIDGIPTAPARRGENLVFYGLGFGPVTPGSAAGEIAQGESTVLNSVEFYFDGMPAEVSYKGLSPGSVGLYQFNVVVPAGLASGDVRLNVLSGGTPIAQSLYLSVAE